MKKKWPQTVLGGIIPSLALLYMIFVVYTWHHTLEQTRSCESVMFSWKLVLDLFWGICDGWASGLLWMTWIYWSGLLVCWSLLELKEAESDSVWVPGLALILVFFRCLDLTGDWCTRYNWRPSSSVTLELNLEPKWSVSSSPPSSCLVFPYLLGLLRLPLSVDSWFLMCSPM